MSQSNAEKKKTQGFFNIKYKTIDFDKEQKHKLIKMVNFKLGNEMWRWINQHDTSLGQRKNLNPRQESNPWPPEHQVGALSTELRELMEGKVI